MYDLLHPPLQPGSRLSRTTPRHQPSARLGRLRGFPAVPHERGIGHSHLAGKVGDGMNTTDREYADLLARLNAIPAQQPARRTYTQAQERQHLIEDLIKENGEAVW